ncbi:hypothetical protein Tco_1262168, partial [Tanacetum coccineum]
MSAAANTTPIVTTVTKTANKEKTHKERDKVNIHDFCEENYDDILPIIMDKVRRDKRKEVHTRLDFAESSETGQRRREGSQNSSAGVSPVRYHTSSRRPRVQDRLRYNNGNVFNRLSHRRRCVHERLSDTYSPKITSATLKSRVKRYLGQSILFKGLDQGNRGPPRDKHDLRARRDGEKTNLHRPADLKAAPVTQSIGSQEIRNFRSSRKMRMPNNVKTYDGTAALEDHLKVFQASDQVERWAMPTWCHMFNSTLIGAAR